MARTNIDLDDKLVREGMKRMKCKSKRELIHLALKELLRADRIAGLLALKGKLHWEGDLSAWRRDQA
jgi:Arc/MetJ family transcription regulator